MAIQDNKTPNQWTLNKKMAIGSSTTTLGTAVDTTAFLKLSYALMCTSRTDGTYTLNLYQSDDDGSTDAYALVPAANLIGSNPVVSAATADGGTLATVGVFGNKRWIKPEVVSTVVTTGGTVEVLQMATLEQVHTYTSPSNS